VKSCPFPRKPCCTCEPSKCDTTCPPLPVPGSCYSWCYPSDQPAPDWRNYKEEWYGGPPPPIPLDAVTSSDQNDYALDSKGNCVDAKGKSAASTKCDPILWDENTFDSAYQAWLVFLDRALGPHMIGVGSSQHIRRDFLGYVVAEPEKWRFFVYLNSCELRAFESVYPKLTSYYKSQNGLTPPHVAKFIKTQKEIMTLVNSVVWFVLMAC
jgi:hypothetical protein